MTNEQQLPEPTRCYVDGCDRENELMLHAANDPWLGGDYCLGHAREIVASTPLIMTCECPICGQARRVLPDDRHQETLTGPGRWLVITETSSYDLDLEDGVTGTLVRRLGTGQGVAQEAVDLPPPVAVELRRDGEVIPVHWAARPMVGEPWTLMLDVRLDGIVTLRRTTIVRQIVSTTAPPVSLALRPSADQRRDSAWVLRRSGGQYRNLGTAAATPVTPTPTRRVHARCRPVRLRGLVAW